MTYTDDILAQQMPELNVANGLTIYGPMGIIIVFLMILVFKKLDGHNKVIVDKLDDVGKDLSAEMRILGHRIKGQAQAALFDSINRETTTPEMKALGMKMLQSISSEDEVNSLRETIKKP